MLSSVGAPGGGENDRNLITRCRRAEERLKVSRPIAEWRGAAGMWGCGGGRGVTSALRLPERMKPRVLLCVCEAKRAV